MAEEKQFIPTAEQLKSSEINAGQKASLPVTEQAEVSSLEREGVNTDAAIGSVVGAETPAPAPTPTEVVPPPVAVTSDEADTAAEDTGTAVTTASEGLNQRSEDAYGKAFDLLDNMAERSEADRASAISNIESQRDISRADTKIGQRLEKGDVGTSLARFGGYLGGSGSTTAYMQSLSQSHRLEVAKLEAAYATAIEQAKVAHDQKDIDLANQLMNTASSYATQINAKRQTDMNLAIQATELLKFERETDALTINAWVADGYTVDQIPEALFTEMDNGGGLKTGTSRGLFEITRKARELQDITDELDLQAKTNQLAKEIFEIKDSYAFGTQFTLGDDILYGTNKGMLEIDNEGNGTLIEYDPETGVASSQDVGFVGLPKDGWEIQMIGGEPFNFHAQTNQYQSLLGSDIGYSNLKPEGKYSSGTFTDENGNPIPYQCGELINEMTGSTVGSTIQEKKEKIDIEDAKDVVAGNTIVIGGTSTGHVAAITKVTPLPNGTFEFIVSEANFDGQGSVRHNGKYYSDDPLVEGYMNTKFNKEHTFGSDGQKSDSRLLAAIERENAGDVSTTADLEGLSLEERLEAKALSVEIFGKRAGTKAENVNDIASLIKAGNTVDEIKDKLRFAGQSPEFSGAVRNAAENLAVAGKMSEQRKETFFNNLDRNIEEGNMDLALETMKIGAISTFPVAEQKQVRGKDRTVEFLLDVKDELKAYAAAGGKTNIFNGTKEKIAGAVGEVVDPKLRELATKIASSIQQYRQGMSGAQFSVPESKEYKALFPNIDKSFKYNEAVIDSLTGSFIGDLDFTFGSVMGNGTYGELYGEAGATVGGQRLAENDDQYSQYRGDVGEGEVLVKNSAGEIGVVSEEESKSDEFTKL